MQANNESHSTFSSQTEETKTSDSGITTKWLTAHTDQTSSLYTFSQCIALSNIHGDGEYKLVVADLGTGSSNMKLKIYKGTEKINEQTILDLPTGVVSFFMDVNEPHTPAIAVASGPYIYIYKNLRPYFKFTLPSLDIHPSESNLWLQASEGTIDLRVLRDSLESLRNDGVLLTSRSLKYIQLNPGEMSNFVQLHVKHPLKRQTVVTCITTLHKNSSDDGAISCIVIGTESKNIYILDPEAFTILATLDLPAIPSFLNVSGVYDVEYRLVAACRNGFVYIFKRGNISAKYSIELHSLAVGVERLNKTMVIGCMDQTLQCFSSKGKKLWELKMPSSITTTAALEYKLKSFSAVLVALSTPEIRIYRDKVLFDVIQTSDLVSGMTFGRFGREDGVLIVIHNDGSLVVKILKRSANFTDAVESNSIATVPKLNIPKKTKLFVDQTMRERENHVEMHRKFQHDLYLLKLKTARQFVEALKNRSNPISTNPEEPLKLNARIQGFGPVFKLVMTLQNMSLQHPSTGLFFSFEYSPKLYSFRLSHIPVSYLVPGIVYTYENTITCLTDRAIQDTVKVYISKVGVSIPLLTAEISMPVSDPYT